MSQDKDRRLQVRTPELPTSTRRRGRTADVQVPTAGAPQVPGRRKFTEGQVDKMIDGGLELGQGALRIGEGVVEIIRIRESADADVRRIDAKTNQLVQQIRAEIEVRREERKTLRDRGTVVVEIIDAITRQIGMIPLDDPLSRRKAIEILPDLVRTAADGSS